MNRQNRVKIKIHSAVPTTTPPSIVNIPWQSSSAKDIYNRSIESAAIFRQSTAELAEYSNRTPLTGFP